MSAQLANLSFNGAVVFRTARDFESTWEDFIERGALPVRPDRELTPLEQLEVYVMAPGMSSPLPLRVEVVQLQAERALLRLLDRVPTKPKLAPEVPSAPSAPAGDAKINGTPPAVLVDEVPLSPSPSTQDPPWQTPPAAAARELAARTQDIDISLMPSPEAEEALFALGPAEAGPATVVTWGPPPITLVPVDQESMEAPPVTELPPVTTLPAYFTGEALQFQTADDYRVARGDLMNVGALVAVNDHKPPEGTVEVKIAVGTRETRAKAIVTVTATATPGTSLVQAIERGGFRPLIEEMDKQPATPEPTGKGTGAFPPLLSDTSSSPSSPLSSSPMPSSATPPRGSPRAFSLPRQGTVKNPTTPAGILALPLARVPTEAELAQPSMPLLLRWLRTTRATFRLEVTADSHPVFTAVFVDGREVRTPASLATLGKSLSMPSMRYTITELGRPPAMTTTGRTQHLIGEVVRALCSHCPVEELTQAFPARPGLCARAITDVVGGLGLPPQHLRFLKADVDGSRFIDEIAKAAVGSRTVWETLYLLEVYNGIAWDEPPDNKRHSGAQSASLRASSASDSTDDGHPAWAPFEGKDHFQVLGLHWSSSPREVPTAYQRLRQQYGPGGSKRPKDKDLADKIMRRLEEAHRVLDDAQQRRAYRREKYNLAWAHQAGLLVQKAKLALYRKDFEDARGILLAAEDIHSTEEARALLEQTKR